MPWLVDFLFPRRLHRLAYFVRLMGMNILLVSLYVSTTTEGAGYWWIAVVVISLYSLFFVLWPRLRDIGMSGWWLLLAFVPITNVLLGLILLFRAPAYHFGTTTKLDDSNPNEVEAAHGRDEVTPTVLAGERKSDTDSGESQRRCLLERCPSCGAEVMFITSICPNCQKEIVKP